MRRVGGMYILDSAEADRKYSGQMSSSRCLPAPVVVGASANVISGPPPRPVRACFAFALPGRLCSPHGSCGWRASALSHSDGAASCNKSKQSGNGMGAQRRSEGVLLLQSELCCPVSLMFTESFECRFVSGRVCTRVYLLVLSETKTGLCVRGLVCHLKSGPEGLVYERR